MHGLRNAAYALGSVTTPFSRAGWFGSVSKRRIWQHLVHRVRHLDGSRDVHPNGPGVAKSLSAVKDEMSCHILFRVWSAVAAVLLFGAASVKSKAAELNPETLKAWDKYVEAQNLRVAESSEANPFLWSDQGGDRNRRLREGEVLIEPMGENPKMVPHGLIHHWIGAMFLPNTDLDNVLKVVRDYDKYKEYYAPNVIESSLLRRAGTNDTVSLLMLNKAVVAKFALEVEFQSSYAPLSKNRCYSVAYSTQVREIEEYGQADQHPLAPNTGHGYIWRLYNVSRFEQRDGGVYIEMEAVALSRDVPTALRWVVNPAVRRTSRGSMLVSLKKTQEAVLARNEVASRAAANDGQIDEKSTLAQKAAVAGGDNGFDSRKPPGQPNHD